MPEGCKPIVREQKRSDLPLSGEVLGKTSGFELLGLLSDSWGNTNEDRLSQQKDHSMKKYYMYLEKYRNILILSFKARYKYNKKKLDGKIRWKRGHLN